MVSFLVPILTFPLLPRFGWELGAGIWSEVKQSKQFWNDRFNRISFSNYMQYNLRILLFTENWWILCFCEIYLPSTFAKRCRKTLNELGRWIFKQKKISDFTFSRNKTNKGWKVRIRLCRFWSVDWCENPVAEEFQSIIDTSV